MPSNKSNIRTMCLAVRPSGHSLFELIAVLAVIAIVVALTGPALQNLREQMRQAQCSHQLRQIGLAIHEFEARRTFWPPGAIDGTAVTDAHRQLRVPAGVEHGWIAFILPGLEQQAVFDRYDFAVDWRAPTNAAARERTLAALLCPSTPPIERIDRGTLAGVRWQAATTDYAAVSGSSTELRSLGLMDHRTAALPTGMFVRNQLLTSADLLDGATHQLLVVEDAARPLRYAQGRRALAGRRTTGAAWADRDNEFIVHGATLDGWETPGACAVNCGNNNEIYAFHPTGANGLFADGSVRWLRHDVDIRLVVAAISRAAGEPFAPP